MIGITINSMLIIVLLMSMYFDIRSIKLYKEVIAINEKVEQVTIELLTKEFIKETPK